MDRSGANEDTYPMLVISRLITVTYLPILLEWEEAQPKNLHVVHLKFQFTALLTQSGINFDIYMHQNLPQFFAETLSLTIFLVFGLFRRNMSPMYLDYCINTTIADSFLMTNLDMETIQENFYYS